MTTDPGMGKHLSNNLTPMIDTPAGPIIGSTDLATGTYKFLGIPYARPPTGRLRWLPPQDLSAWKTPFHAEKFGMPAAQNPSNLMEVRGQNGEPPEREECLHLNIFSPAIKPGKKLPVMFWIHGGSFYMGSGCQTIYNGRYLASSGRAIVVTFNYRLGALGFLRLKDISDIPSTGNEGLLDQIAALKWVKYNISEFGGDPNNITIFGESAGAMSIVTLLEISEFRGLYSRAIAQSGHPGAVHTVGRANLMAEAFIKHLEIISNGAAPQECSTNMLLKAQKAILDNPDMTKNWGQLPFKPVYDSELLNCNTDHIIETKKNTGTSLLLGNNLEEWNLFSAANPDTYNLDHKKICQQLEWLIPERTLYPIIEYYHRQAISITDSPWPEWSRTWNLLLTDLVFTLPGLRHLKAYEGKSFHYHFTQPLAAQPLLGACHAAELAYIFGTHREESLQTLYGGETDAHILCATMQEAWLSYAESGNPGNDWPLFTGMQSKRFGNHPRARGFNAAELLSVWQDIPDETLNKYL
ncbi:carboxylesterase/lipase family protein [Microbulbifer epialgicus]|uniref:Carboxylic ester hydrolase n=1 Tax=Microbulbifer epialgicus TaxID=393907 RepID=A0ABV4P3C0_9GAMM